MIGEIGKTFQEIKSELFAGNISGLITQYSDIVMAILVLMILTLMILPVPTFVLSFLLVCNLTLAFCILLVSIYISEPTQLASYPTILLITTLFRLGLSIAATRLILLQGDAGAVIETFGKFVVGGNIVVGGVVFLIITLVNFLVITKGSERVSEVAARFTLDAMPGKQMSIDADLRAGAFDMAEARRRRAALARESQLHGSMDGAMKFVKGDAIAGIIITLINIIGGLTIGVLMRGMDLAHAVKVYTILTIGDGLVAQVPSLLIAVSAGIVTTRVAGEDPTSNIGKDISAQIMAQPKAIAIASILLFFFAITFLIVNPATSLPFFIMSVLAGGIAYSIFKKGGPTVAGDMALEAASAEKEEKQKVSRDPQISLTIPIAIEVSKDLTPLIDLSQEGKFLSDLIPKMRQLLYQELGVIFPGVQVSGNAPIAENSYLFRLKEVPVEIGKIVPGHVLVNDSADNIRVYGLKGIDIKNPANGKPAAWIPAEQREQARGAGLVVWEPQEVILLHLTGFLKRYAAEFVGIQEVQNILSVLSRALPNLVQETVPKVVSIYQLTEVLQRLVQEEISIRDMKSILQALSEWGRVEKDTIMLTEYVRSSMKRYISFRYTGGNPILFVYVLDPEIEDAIRGAIRRTSSGTYIALDPAITQDILAAFRREIGNLPPTAQQPVIVTDQEIRRFVRRIAELEFRNLAVLSYQELAPELSIQPLARISLRGQLR
ncbi:MAG: type III secretion system export apparatus subunit SctV [Acidobacteriota bacterium]|nr:type III secretion system export apparatus subunit SctV [Blastocatellia bacterium]MDW8411068.1 type III secretion system export apparatus subunit SctV [Acidobacteriota bacterium]